MSDVVSFAEIDGQQVDLLPSRTLLQVSFGPDPINPGAGATTPVTVTAPVHAPVTR